MTRSGATSPIRAAARRRLRATMEARAAVYPEARLADSLVVVAPHPDDEVLGCGGLIHRKRTAGASVGVVFLTDGAASHRSFIEAAELRRRRRDEAVEAAARLGVGPGDLAFLDLPDGRLADHVEEAAAAVARLLEARRPAEIAVPHRREPPADHRAAWAAVRRAAGSLPRVVLLEYGVWIWRGWPVVPLSPGPPTSRLTAPFRAAVQYLRLARAFDRFLPVEGAREAKRAALDAHATQMSRPPDVAEWPVLGDVDGGAFLEALLGAREYFRETALAAGVPTRSPSGRAGRGATSVPDAP